MCDHIHYENMPMQYLEISLVVKIFACFSFSFFAQNMDCGYSLEPPFGAKIRNIGVPMHTPVFLKKKKWGLRGYIELHRHVFLMNIQKPVFLVCFNHCQHLYVAYLV